MSIKINAAPLGDVLRRTLSPILNFDAAKHDDRVRLTKQIRKYIEGLPECVNYDRAAGVLTLGDKLVFGKRLGSDSADGTVLIARGKGFGRIFKIAAKIVPDDPESRQEVALLEATTRLVLSGRVLNMPCMYGYRTCHSEICLRDNATCPARQLYGADHVVMLNEVATDTLASYLDAHPFDPAFVSGAVVQVMCALLAFQTMLGVYHGDSHLSNVLFHSVPAGGVWWYQIDGTDVFVPNTGHLMVLWDFGRSMSKQEVAENAASYAVSDFQLFFSKLSHWAPASYMQPIETFLTATTGDFAPYGVWDDHHLATFRKALPAFMISLLGPVDTNKVLNLKPYIVK